MKQTYKHNQIMFQRQIVYAAILTGIILLLAFIGPKLSANAVLNVVPNAVSNVKCDVKNSIANTSTEYGFTIRVPVAWKGNYRICETKKETANVADYEFSIRKNKRSEFQSVILLHVYDKDRMSAEGVTFLGKTVSELDNIAVTAEETGKGNMAISKYAKEVPKILKGFRWLNLEKFQKVIESL